MRLCIIVIAVATANILSTSGSEDVDDTNVVRHHGHRFHHKHHRSFTRHADDNQSPQEPDSESTSTEGGQRTCLGCANRELLVEYTKHNLKKEILRKLGLKVAPNITRGDNPPKHLISKLLKEAEEKVKSEEMHDEPILHQIRPSILEGEEYSDEDDFHFQTRQITILSQDAAEFVPEIIHQNWNIRYLPLSSHQLQNGLWKGMMKATLYVFLPPAPSPNDTNVWIEVSYAAIDKNDQPFLKQQASAKYQLRETKSGWAPIDITSIVALWFKNLTSNYGFVLKATTDQGVKLDISPREAFNVPYLVMDIKDSTNNFRRKRTLGKVCSEENDSLESHCCMWPLTIDFEEEFGWNFIIHPTKYQANFCSGDCQLGVMMPTSLHTHVLQLSNIAPCCSPQKMSGINIIYVDENKNVVLGKLPKMKVERCGCT